MDALPKTRKEAQAVRSMYYFTGKPCKHGHIAPRKTKGACVECLKVEWVKANETRADYFRAYNQSEAGKESKQRYYEANRELVIARAQARPREEKQAYRNAWKEKNTLAIHADNKNRRRKHRAATPPWLSRRQKTEMRALYQIAMTTTAITGVPHVIDHIWPLRSDFVCGLHVPWNLRVITQAQNLAKSNSLPSDEEALAFPKLTWYKEKTKTTSLPTDLADLPSRTVSAI